MEFVVVSFPRWMTWQLEVLVTTSSPERNMILAWVLHLIHHKSFTCTHVEIDHFLGTIWLPHSLLQNVQCVSIMESFYIESLTFLFLCLMTTMAVIPVLPAMHGGHIGISFVACPTVTLSVVIHLVRTKSFASMKGSSSN